MLCNFLCHDFRFHRVSVPGSHIESRTGLYFITQHFTLSAPDKSLYHGCCISPFRQQHADSNPNRHCACIYDPLLVTGFLGPALAGLFCYLATPVQNKKAGYQTNNRLFELNIDVRYNMSRTISSALTHPSIGMETGKHEVHAEVGEDDRKETDAGDDCHLCPFPATDVT